MLPSRFPRPVRLALYALAVAILLAMCLAPTEDLPDPGTGDRFEHTAAWFILTLSGLILSPRRILAIPIFALIFGVIVEILQAATPFGRHGDPLDLAADIVGVTLASLLWFGVRRLGPRVIDAG